MFDGQRVLGPARDIQEMRNAIAAYEALSRWNPTDRVHLLDAHGLLMAGLIDSSASEQWRSIWLRSSKKNTHSAMALPVSATGRFFSLTPWHSSPKTIWSSSALSGSRN